VGLSAVAVPGGLVNEDQAIKSGLVLPFFPPRPSTRYVWTVAFAGHDAFF